MNSDPQFFSQVPEPSGPDEMLETSENTDNPYVDQGTAGVEDTTSQESCKSTASRRKIQILEDETVAKMRNVEDPDLQYDDDPDQARHENMFRIVSQNINGISNL